MRILLQVEVTQVITQLKRRASDTVEGTAQVINNSIQNITQAAQGKLPTLSSMRKVVRRTRINIEAPPPTPNTLADLEIPANSSYRTYEHHPGQCKILLFIFDCLYFIQLCTS